MTLPTSLYVTTRPTPTQGFWFAAAVALGVFVRAVLLASKWRDGLLLNDSLWYSGQATQIARGNGFSGPFVSGPSAEHGPLTPLLLAPVSGLDNPVPWQRLVITVVGIVAVMLIGLLAVAVAGWTAGVFAAALAAVYPNLWMNDSLVMSESVAALAVTGALLAAVSIGRGRHRVVMATSCGVLVGLAALARSELLLLAPLIALVIWRNGERSADDTHIERDLRSATAIVAAALAVVSPWVVRNLTSFDRPVVMTTNDGATLLGANCADSYSGADIGGWSLFCVLDAGGRPDEEPSIRSERYRSLAFDHICENLPRLPLVVTARIGRGFDLIGVQNLVVADVGEERYRWASWAGVVAWWMLLAPMVVGIRLLSSRTRWILLAPAVSVLVTTVCFYGGHRIRSPMEPVVVVLAGVALARWATGRGRHDAGDGDSEAAAGFTAEVAR